MTISQIIEILNAELLTPDADCTREVHAACGSDMDFASCAIALLVVMSIRTTNITKPFKKLLVPLLQRCV